MTTRSGSTVPSSTTAGRVVVASGRSGRRRRLFEGVGFVATWVALGFLLPGNSDVYLLVGIPLTIGFQVLVRRRPLRELWVRDGSGFRLDRRGLLLATLLAIVPATFGFLALRAGDWPRMGWHAAAVAGAVAAAYAVRSTSAVAVLRSAALAIAIGVGGNLVVLGGIHVATAAPIELSAVAGTVLKSLALYFPATFLIEEVAFRGALDAHVQHSGDGRGWQTALLVSALWGLWHLPVADGLPLPILFVFLVTWHCAIGVPLSFAWRRTGNLAGPAFAHCAIDAARNALMLGL